MQDQIMQEVEETREEVARRFDDDIKLHAFGVGPQIGVGRKPRSRAGRRRPTPLHNPALHLTKTRNVRTIPIHADF